MNSKSQAINLLANKAIVQNNTKKKSHKNSIVCVGVGTRRAYTACLKLYLEWRVLNGISSEVQSNKNFIMSYLEEKAEICKQKTVCQNRMALNMAFHKQLPFVKSLVNTTLNSRNYSLAEVKLLVKNLHVKNIIAILICYYSGLRAHELATLERIHEGTRSNTRKWSSELFTAIEQYQIYIVTGKGGLRRFVAIPIELATIIEARRLPEPRKVRDREIYYQMHYDLGFGKALSQCFSRASLKYLGWSTGLHGLRHSYAKNRIRKLIKIGFTFDAAKSIVSQELGHFRPSIVNCYMR